MLRPSLGFETGVFTSDSRNGLTTPFVLGTRALELSAVERVKKSNPRGPDFDALDEEVSLWRN